MRRIVSGLMAHMAHCSRSHGSDIAHCFRSHVVHGLGLTTHETYCFKSRGSYGSLF